jgi:hypoxanthine phosphoribosyltransferase
MSELPNCRRTTWADADRWADSLAEQIREAEHVPEVIVALTRGGWVPARLLADRLGIKRLLALRAQHWGVTATKSGKAELTEGLSGPVEGQKVLVLDDITDTGESLELASLHVEERHPSRLETATFLHITHSKFRPTYTAEEIPRESWVWVVFPWNYWEDLRSLVERVHRSASTAAEVHRILSTDCHLTVPVGDIATVLDGLRSG